VFRVQLVFRVFKALRALFQMSLGPKDLQVLQDPKVSRDPKVFKVFRVSKV
jgi:hypothetical protein